MLQLQLLSIFTQQRAHGRKRRAWAEAFWIRLNDSLRFYETLSLVYGVRQLEDLAKIYDEIGMSGITKKLRRSA